jgi:HK97 family phage prohead protease
MMKTEKRLLSAGTKKLELENQVNDKTRTLELIWSTGASVLRSAWNGTFNEVLSMEPGHVDLSRLQNGAPLLAEHDKSLDKVIGVVVSASIESGIGRATVRFDNDEYSEKIFQKVKNKVLRNISVGYSIRKMQDISKQGDSVPTYKAIDWQPLEISVVSVGADQDAQFRNKVNNQYEVEIELQSEQKKEDMNENEKKVIQQERQRQTEIREAVRTAKLDATFADELCSKDITADEARRLVLVELGNRQPEPINNVHSVDSREDNHSKRMKCFEEAVLHRLDPKNFAVTDGGRSLFGRNLLQQAEFFIPRHMMESDSAYAKRSMSSSDLPLALANVAEKALQKAYVVAPKSYERWCGKKTVRNYKEASFVQLSDYPALVERPEGAEYEYGSVAEKNEVAKISDYGKIVKFSSQMIVNDDLGSLQKLASGGGQAAARLVNRLAYLALMTNKTMKDGVALYHASHGNLGTPGAISETSLNEAIKAMMVQTNVGGLDKLNLQPRFLICGPDKKVEATKQLASIQAAQSSNVNPFSGSLELIVDAEITGNQYYFACDPNVIDTVSIIYLEGQEQPSVQSRVNFLDDALEMKVACPVAAAPMEWRGLYKNAGN